MLGLSVLFFLGVWIVITLVAMVIGWKFAKKHWGIKAGFIGLFSGFMLTMGGFIVYWTIEYIQIQRTVAHLCETEGGIKVYVTPEEWRKQIGEEEWNTLTPYTKEKISYSTEIGKKIILDNIKFEYSKGNTHLNGGILENDKVALYITYTAPKPIYGSKSISLLVEKNTHKVLLKDISFYYGTGPIANDLSGLKFWLNNIKDCNYTKEFIQIAHKYSNTNNTGVKK